MVHNKAAVRDAGYYFPKGMRGFAVIGVCLWLYAGKMTAEAEPALLQSEGAVIYEQTNEESNAVGNLVQGSSFELLGTVTAEDGSAWYSVSAFGVQGYIRGNVEIGTDTAGQNAAEAGAGAEETANEEAEAAGQEGAAGAEAGNTGEEPEAAGQEEVPGEEPETAGQEVPREAEAGNTGQEGEIEPEEDMPENQPSVYQGKNTREKTYAVGSGSIKGKTPEDRTDAGGEIPESGKGNGTALAGRINKTVLFFLLAVTGSALTAGVSYKKLKRELNGEKNKEKRRNENSKSVRNRKTAHRKKRHRRKKGKSKKNGSGKKQSS